LDLLPYRILERKRAGLALGEDELRAVVAGAADGSWSDAQLAAFLMAAAIRGLDGAETRALTSAMLGSGERWRLADEVPRLCDKHSTGGVGDKVSLVLGPLLAACGLPVAMLVGRGLGHTGGTADKLESIPGLGLELDRGRCLELLARCGLAIGVATRRIAPADRRLYPLRDATATVDSLPLITASILSKKLATGPAALVFDIKTGEGAFLAEPSRAHELARMLVDAAAALGTPARALVTDMSQPLGRWSGHAAEVDEALACLAGEGPEDLTRVTVALAAEVAGLAGRPLGEDELRRELASGCARERFLAWAELQGAEAAWLRRPKAALAPVERPLVAPRSGRLARVATRRLGLLLLEAAKAGRGTDAGIDHSVSLATFARLGQKVAAGDELARLYLRTDDDALAERFGACFVVEEGEGGTEVPELIRDRIG
jgi:pyrimidine-nucleoside phosphorylase